VSVTTEKFAEDLAREAMNEPGFKAQWRAWVREASQRMFETLNHPPPKRRRRRKES
jgi:hypothetical protein